MIRPFHAAARRAGPAVRVLAAAAVLAAGLSGPAAPPAAAAAAIETAACTVGAGVCATGISGLEVGGAVYDVSFSVDGSYDDVHAGSPSPFLGDAGLAASAAQAILGLLQAADVGGIVSRAAAADFFFVAYGEHGGTAGNPDRVDVKYGFYDTVADSWFAGIGDCGGGAGCLVAANDYAADLPLRSYAWAVFAAAAAPGLFAAADTLVVPAPGGLAVLGFGLAGLGLVRRRAAA